MVKKNLKQWNHDDFGNIDSHISRLESLIQSYDDLSNQRSLDEEELDGKKSAIADLWMWMKRKEVYWAQNSRVSWLKEGDRNTKFFHTVASNKRRKNSISSIKVNGVKIDDPPKLKSSAAAFFKDIFKEEWANRPVFEGLDFSHLSQEQASKLILPFSEEEIDKAVFSCDSNKAPGPDGFNFKFIKSAWEYIKHDIYMIIRDFHEKGHIPRGCNTAFIALIPKTEMPNEFKDYRPISMVGCIYKIIAKLMSKRLQNVMQTLVGPFQFSYIEGRYILDGALIASELIDSCKKKSIEAALLKLDFHKAYDSVSWQFLAWILRQMCFPPLWCKWIMSCVSASILINGSPSKPFKLQRGLRQGDPLSPFLFVLIVEALNQLIRKATSMQLWNGIGVSYSDLKVTHLQYADDTLIFCEANLESLMNIKKMLIVFQLASGLQVNFHKSSLIGINTSSSWTQMAAQILLCKIGSIPFSYLGLPIGGNTSSIQLWEPIMLKMTKKLASWKGKMLSIGGRLTLIKSSLTSLPLYFMSIYPAPKGVMQKIIKLVRSFLWGGNSNKSSMPLVSWKIVQLPKACGGLSIGNMVHKNLALLFKWIWRYFDDPSHLWCQVIKAKYKYPSTLTISDLSIPPKGGPWKLICSTILKHPGAKKLALNGVRRSINKGANCLFWYDSWIDTLPLKNKFPRLFLISILPNASVDSFGFWEGAKWVWTFSWKRHLRPQDMVEKVSLLQLLQNVCPAHDGKDELIWCFNSSGKFSSKSFSQELDNLGSVIHNDAIMGVWKGLVPHRIEIFVWAVLLGKINTRQKLAHLNIIPAECDSCILCSSSSESCNHLMLHCEFAQKLWQWWLDLWGVKWVFPLNIRCAFEQWRSPKKLLFFKKVWHASFFIIVWSIWKERNLRIFENSFNTAKQTQDLILLRLGWWIKGWSCEFPYSPMDIQRNPSCLMWPGFSSCVNTSKISVAACEWFPPSEDCLKWNVDASVNPLQSRAAIGGVLRNKDGKFMCVFSSPIPFMEINCAEILAIHRAIMLSLYCETTKSSKLVLESDSSNAVLWSNGDRCGPWNMHHHLNFIRNARKKHLDISISHMGRSANSIADALAKQGLHRQEEFIAWL
ncbi:uncharacterized protein LOC125492703 [Beta vulgaris subsp. vulgaris]|uniref:uncharacterized protein LOC125492703 n=1 Tax=Beta vulgaris subsp. vulgaris TaxID=3555 RepID=UPI0020375F5E|nr:uncharacterized protein LOC125492703 [Beta vulgaris subsp. vulgaris]